MTQYLQNPNFLFLYSLAAFALDGLSVHFLKFPLFVATIPATLGLMLYRLIIAKKVKLFHFLLMGVFVLVGILDNFLYLYDRKNISDLLFLLLFVTSYEYFTAFAEELTAKTIHIFFLVVVLMFSTSFTGFNIPSKNPNDKDYIKDAGHLTVKDNKELNVGTSGYKPDRSYRQNRKNYMEHKRTYHNGMFRIPHVASYFFSFLFLYMLNGFISKRRYWYLLAAILTLLMVVLTGSRTMLVAMSLALFIYLVLGLRLKYLLVLLAIPALVVIFREDLFLWTRETVLGQYFALINTVIDNPNRISRLMIWRSWWHEISGFSGLNWLTGKGYVLSLLVNRENIGTAVWFHNDFFSVLFSYGLPALLLFTFFFLRIYKENRLLINSNLFLFTFYFSMLIASFINGFYTYYPVFLVFMFVFLIKKEKQHQDMNTDQSTTVTQPLVSGSSPS
jgi:hypothetical protein